MLIDFKLGQSSVILRFKILDASATTGAGLKALAYNTAGMKISTIADNEAIATTYSGSNVETVATLGTFGTITAGKCQFREVDATNHPGVYELHLADARFAVTGAKSLLVSVSGPTNCAETDFIIPLRAVDPYDALGERNAVADALLSRANAIDGKTPKQILQIMAAVLAGKVSGAGSGLEP